MNGPSNTFTQFLSDYRNGEALNDASVALQEVTKAVRETGKAGSITLKLVIKPAARGVGTTVAIDAHVNTKVPPPERTPGIFFTTEEGLLQRDNPEQKMMDLRIAPSPQTESSAPLKSVAAS